MSITLKQILDLVGTLDDRPGEDVPRERFRRSVRRNVAEAGQVRDYVEGCLDERGNRGNIIITNGGAKE